MPCVYVVKLKNVPGGGGWLCRLVCGPDSVKCDWDDWKGCD